MLFFTGPGLWAVLTVLTAGEEESLWWELDWCLRGGIGGKATGPSLQCCANEAPAESRKVCDVCSSRQFGCRAVLLFSGQVRFGFCQFIGSLRPPGSEALPWVLGFVGKPFDTHTGLQCAQVRKMWVCIQGYGIPAPYAAIYLLWAGC